MNRQDHHDQARSFFLVSDKISQLNEEKIGLAEQDTPSLTDASMTASETTTESSSLVSTSRTPVVGFRSIQIREFDRIVGDHPDVRHGGPPLSIGWKYVEGDAMDLDAYEQQKQQAQQEEQEAQQANEGWPKLPGLRRLSSGSRRDLLRLHFNIPWQDIEEAEAEVERTKKQRAQTNQQRKVFARTEEILQSAHRKLKRTFSRDSLDYQSFPKRRDMTVASAPPSLPTSVPPLAPPPAKPLRMREISV